MKLSFRWLAGAMGVFLFAATLAAQGQQQGQGGQQGQPAAPQGGARQGGGAGGGRGFTNLTVLPQNIPAPQLIQIMQGFESALGVTCEHCHVFLGQGNPMNDLASDAKQPKKTARIMLLAARDFNAKLTPADLGKQAANITPVMCGSCHRGKAIPDYVAPPPPARGGGPAGGGARQGGARGN